MTYEECIITYTSKYEDYCKQQFPDDGASSSDSTGGFFSNLFSDPLAIVVIIIAIVVLMLLSIRIVRQQQVAVVERLGRYNRSMQPGFHVIIPFFERIADRVDLEQFNLNVTSDVKTKDDQMVTLPVVVILKVIPENAERSVYVVSEPEEAIQALVSNEVKAKASDMTLDEIYADRKDIKDAVFENYKDIIESYGYVLEQVVIDNPKLPDELRAAYNSIAVAEKSKQAAASVGEALKIQKVKEAEAEGAAMVIQGDSYITIRNKYAEGNKEAIVKMIEGTDMTSGDAARILMSIDTNNAIRDAAANKGTTVVVATPNPGDGTLGMLAGK